MYKTVAVLLAILMTQVSSFEPPTMHELETGAVYSVKYASKPQERAKSYSSAAKDFSQFPDKSKQPQKDFTRAEVAKYDGEDGRPIYLIFDTGVYDVTDYVAFHPAGPEPIKKHSGEDVTEVMKATSMPQWVYDKLFTFKVGQVTD